MLTIGETQAISHATEQQTQERRIVHLAGEDLTPKNPLERERRPTAQAETASTNSGAEGTSLNEF